MYSTSEFPNTFFFFFFSILNPLFILMFIYFRYRSIYDSFWSSAFILHKVINYFLLYFVEYSAYWKMFQIKITDLYFMLPLFCMISCFKEIWQSSVGVWCDTVEQYEQEWNMIWNIYCRPSTRFHWLPLSSSEDEACWQRNITSPLWVCFMQEHKSTNLHHVWTTCQWIRWMFWTM
jgi:hypothetical protein